MGKRVHGKVFVKRRGQVRRTWQWCTGRMKPVSIYAGGGERCECGARWFCY